MGSISTKCLMQAHRRIHVHIGTQIRPPNTLTAVHSPVHFSAAANARGGEDGDEVSVALLWKVTKECWWHTLHLLPQIYSGYGPCLGSET
jgi:hypothetical protein